MSHDTPEQVSVDVPPAKQLMQMIFGFVTTQAISVAARLGLADLLRDGAKSAEELAQLTGTQARPLYRILRSLASGVGIFAEDDTGRFGLTPLAEPLRSDTADSLRDFSIFIGAEWHWRAWGDLFSCAQSGQPAFEKIYGKAFFEYLGENNGAAHVFNDAMTSISTVASAAVVDGYDFTGINKLVDVGGGHGASLSILEKYPQMHGVLIDAPSVIAGTKEAIEARELSNRCEAVGGDFFASVPGGGDAYIMKHIIHDWNDERASTILRCCHRQMPAEGRLLVVEMVIPEGNAPSFGKLMDL